jgi:ABC-type Mn2+/Zn2+ transport system ATPase subunit
MYGDVLEWREHQLHPKCKVAVLGDNGTGKSFLINLLMFMTMVDAKEYDSEQYQREAKRKQLEGVEDAKFELEARKSQASSDGMESKDSSSSSSSSSKRKKSPHNRSSAEEPLVEIDTSPTNVKEVKQQLAKHLQVLEMYHENHIIPPNFPSYLLPR